MASRVSLVDPLLYQSNYVDLNPEPQFKIDFWSKFNIYSFLFNIIIPLFVILFVMFVLKGRAKHGKGSEKKKNKKRLPIFKRHL